MRAKLAPYFDEFGLGLVPQPKEPFPTFDEERLEFVLELRPRIVRFHFGPPEASAVRRLKEADCIILSSATTVAEARSVETNGVDVIIAQGFEAGGDASGAQIGTAFLGCLEAAVSPLHRAQLRTAADDGTELTRAFTGRPARASRNRFITEMAATESLEFPLQGSLVGPL